MHGLCQCYDKAFSGWLCQVIAKNTEVCQLKHKGKDACMEKNAHTYVKTSVGE
jgi:hypothetical protein